MTHIIADSIARPPHQSTQAHHDQISHEQLLVPCSQGGVSLQGRGAEGKQLCWLPVLSGFLGSSTGNVS